MGRCFLTWLIFHRLEFYNELGSVRYTVEDECLWLKWDMRKLELICLAKMTFEQSKEHDFR
jgi:hypothetical protein